MDGRLLCIAPGPGGPSPRPPPGPPGPDGGPRLEPGGSNRLVRSLKSTLDGSSPALGCWDDDGARPECRWCSAVGDVECWNACRCWGGGPRDGGGPPCLWGGNERSYSCDGADRGSVGSSSSGGSSLWATVYWVPSPNSTTSSRKLSSSSSTSSQWWAFGSRWTPLNASSSRIMASFRAASACLDACALAWAASLPTTAKAVTAHVSTSAPGNARRDRRVMCSPSADSAVVGN